MELKNDISIKGTLKSVDQYLNIKLDDIGVLEEVRYPHLVSRPAGTNNESRRPPDNGASRWEDGCRRALLDDGPLQDFITGSQSVCSGSGLMYCGTIVIGQECVHKRKCGAICAFACCGGRYGAAGGCDEER